MMDKNREKYLNQLETYSNSLGIAKNHQGWGRLVDYLYLLDKWNKVYNLTSIRNLDEMFTKHILDSMAVAPYIDSERLIDVGTGGGLPGIPLAILFPERQVDLLDSNSKKTRFLIQAKAELKLDNVEVIKHRVETYQPAVMYDGVVSRAFASLDDMLSLTKHLLADSGCWWAMKSQKTQEELEQLPNFAKMVQVFDLVVPNLEAERTLIQLKKVKS
jgi:16S rRNA (guanine527-N7)-methyltransferase